MKTTRHAFLTGICLAAALVACGDRDNYAVDSAAGITALPQEYTEAELLGLFGLANDGTIALAKLAQSKATSPEVKALAGKALEGHNELGRKAMDLAAQLNLTPVVPSADESLTENNRKWMDDLNQKQAGKDWDKAYLEYEIDRHETILDEVKDALSREQRPEVRAFLDEVRTHIEGHIPAYKDVVNKLEA